MNNKNKIAFYLSQDISKELWVAYQPIVNLYTGEIISAEVLLRWQSPKIGVVCPSKFIPVAEKTGQIKKLTEWILKEVSGQLELNV